MNSQKVLIDQILNGDWTYDMEVSPHRYRMDFDLEGKSPFAVSNILASILKKDSEKTTEPISGFGLAQGESTVSNEVKEPQDITDALSMLENHANQFVITYVEDGVRLYVSPEVYQAIIACNGNINLYKPPEYADVSTIFSEELEFEDPELDEESYGEEPETKPSNAHDDRKEQVKILKPIAALFIVVGTPRRPSSRDGENRLYFDFPCSALNNELMSQAFCLAFKEDFGLEDFTKFSVQYKNDNGNYLLDINVDKSAFHREKAKIAKSLLLTMAKDKEICCQYLEGISLDARSLRWQMENKRENTDHEIEDLRTKESYGALYIAMVEELIRTATPVLTSSRPVVRLNSLRALAIENGNYEFAAGVRNIERSVAD